MSMKSNPPPYKWWEKVYIINGKTVPFSIFSFNLYEWPPRIHSFMYPNLETPMSADNAWNFPKPSEFTFFLRRQDIKIMD